MAMAGDASVSHGSRSNGVEWKRLATLGKEYSRIHQSGWTKLAGAVGPREPIVWFAIDRAGGERRFVDADAPMSRLDGRAGMCTARLV